LKTDKGGYAYETNYNINPYNVQFTAYCLR